MGEPGRLGRVLVTGGLGFIGHHLCDGLLNVGAQVVIVDDERTSAVPCSWFNGRARVELSALRSYHASGDFDWVCHLAGPVGPTRVMNSRGGVAHAIVDSVGWLLEHFGDKPTRLLYVSTSEVYGVSRPVKEDDDLTVLYPYSGRREYSCGKLLGEIMLTNAARNGGNPPLIIRPFNVAGPRQSDRGGFVLPRFALAIMAGRPMTIYGSGAQRRCFTHVGDIVDAIIGLMAVRASGIFNVGNTENNVSIAELADRLARIAAQIDGVGPPQVKHVDPRVLHGPDYEEAPDKIPDVSKLRQAIRWQPKHDLDSLLSDVMKSVAQRRDPTA